MRIWVTPLLVLTLVAANARCDIIDWTNVAGGDWSATNNWSPHRIPGGLDTAVITNSGSYAISINTTNATVGNLLLGSSDGSGTQSLSINAGTFTLVGQATVNPSGQFNVSGGILNGNPESGTVTINGTVIVESGGLSGRLTIASNAVLNLTNSAASSSLLLTALVLTNYGTVVWNNVDLDDTFSPHIYNYGIWEAQTDNTFYGASSGTGTTVFNNYGTFRKSAGSHSDLDSNVTFNNYGTLDAQSGQLEIDGSGTGTGVFNTANGAVIYLAPMNFILTGNPTFTGSGGIAGFLSGSNAVLNGTVRMDSGALSGTLTVASNAVLYLTYSNQFSLFNLISLVLTNYGTVVWSNIDLYGLSSPQIDNYGLWEAPTDNTIYGNGNPPDGTGPMVFNNYGIFRKTGGTGTTLLDNYTTFNNYGTLDAQSGQLEIDGSGTGTGVFNTANGAVIYLTPMNFILTGNPTFTGSGGMAGILNGSNAVLNGTVRMDSGGLSGTLTVASNAVLYLTYSNQFTSFSLISLVLTNYGTVVWSNIDLNGFSSPQINNYGLWETPTDNTFYGNGNAPYGTGPTVFNNYGIFRKTGGSHSDLDSNVSFNNYGTLDDQNGVLEIDGTNTLTGGTLSFGINSASDFGAISLPGNVALAGALRVNFNNGFSPVAGDSFALLTYGSETNTFFASLNLPHLPLALLWQENYGATAFTLNVTTAPPLQLSQVTIQNGTNFSFAWNAAYGQTYQLQSTTNLASTNWIDLGGTITGTNGTMTLSKHIGPDVERFYRLVLLPPQ